MEIRDYLGIKKKEKLLLSARDAGNGRILITIAKAPPDLADSDCCSCSKNGAYLRKNKNGVK